MSNKPHIHAELIKAWADGAKIQFKNMDGEWQDCTTTPGWSVLSLYRIKPEPKPDIVRYARASFTEYDWNSPNSVINNRDKTVSFWSKSKRGSDNVKATFDGETGELKSVELIK